MDRIKKIIQGLATSLSKRDLVWSLLLANVIIWAVAYNQTNTFYNHYVELLTKTASASSVLPESDNTKEVARTLQPTPSQPSVGSKKWIRAEWERAGADWSKVYAVMQCESYWDNNKYNVNTNGTIDLGIYMFNSCHIPSRLSLECASDPVCSTKKAVELWGEQGFAPWVCANNLGIK